MSTHTPGPWNYTETTVGKWDGIRNTILATVGGEDAEANARLIAAAPRMLALLEEYAAKAKDVTNPAPGSLIERTRAILRDVEGERNG